MASMSIDAIVKQVSLTFDTLETLIVPSSTAEITKDGLYALGETTDLFKVWLSNTTVAREKCTSYEDCLRNNPELRLTLAELLVDIKDDLAEAQDIAQHYPGHDSTGDVEVSKVPDHSDTPLMLSLDIILVDVNSAITCLMRLSKPLLDNHWRHRTTDRYCTEGDTHHVQGLQRLLPRTEFTNLEQLSRSTCARRSELLTMNQQRMENSGTALKPLNDDAFLRVVLLELASVTGEATVHEPDASSGIEVAQEVEENRNALGDTGKVESQVTGRWKDGNAEQVDSVLSTPQYMPKQPNSAWSSTARFTRDQALQEQLSDTQRASKAGVINSNSSDDTAESMTISACTRCRARKTRCDPGLPKCGPCERTMSTCEYYDPLEGELRNRNYIIYLQHKVAELESQLEQTADLDSLDAEGAEAKSPELPAPASPTTTDTSQRPRSKTCIICNRSITYYSKSELRQHYLEDLQPYICLHGNCDSRDIRYPTLEMWIAHIRSSHGQVFQCLFGCTQTVTTRTTFEDHLRVEHRAQFTDAELPTLVELCKKHQLNNTTSQCPLCGEVAASSERFYQHLANHMEEFALLSLMPNLPCKFSTNIDVVPTSSEMVAPDIVQQTATLGHEITPSKTEEHDLPALFWSQPGFQNFVLSESNSNPISTTTYTVEFTDLTLAFKAAYKLNHHPISTSNSSSNSNSPNPNSRLSIKLASNTLKVRITSDGPPPDAQLLPSSIEAYTPTASISTRSPAPFKQYQTHEQTDQSWWSSGNEASLHDEREPGDVHMHT